MTKIILLTVGIIFIFSEFVFADVSIKAEVDKINITTEQTLRYKVSISATQKNLAQPKFPDLSNFYIVSQSQSSNISFAKSAVKTVVIFELILAPKNAGEFTIGPCVIKAKDKTYSSESFQIKVAQGKIRTKPQPKKIPQTPEEEEAEESQITL